jgi:hypothetical protein
MDSWRCQYLTKSWPLLILSGQSGTMLGVWPIGPHRPRLLNTHRNRVIVRNCQISNFAASGVTLMDSWRCRYLTKSWPLHILSGRRGTMLGVWPIVPHCPRLQNTHPNRFIISNSQISNFAASGMTLMDSWRCRYLTKSWPLHILSGRRGTMLGVWPIGPHSSRLQKTHRKRFTISNGQISKGLQDPG